MSPEIVVAVCSYGRERVLIDTLHSLIKHVLCDTVMIVLLDQNQSLKDEIRSEIDALVAKGAIAYHKLEKPSLTGARNFALREYKAPLFLFVDDDVLVHNGFLSAYIKIMQNPDVAAATGQVYEVRGGSQTEFIEPPSGAHLHFEMMAAGWCDDIIGANHMIRRDAAMAVGGYDENYAVSARCEDLDMAARLVKAGCRIYYDPDAWLVHRLAPSGGGRIKQFNPSVEWSHTANFALYAFKHSHSLAAKLDFIWRALRTGPLRKWIVSRPAMWLPAWRSAWQGFRFAWRNRLTMKNSYF